MRLIQKRTGKFYMGGFKSIFLSKISTERESCFSKDIMPTNGFAQPFVGIISFLSMFHGAGGGT